MAREFPGERNQRHPADPQAQRERAERIGAAAATVAAAAVKAAAGHATAKATAKATAAANAKAAKAKAKADQFSAKGEHIAQAAERFDRLAQHLEALELWTRAEPGQRKPRYSRDDLAAAAVRIADEEGFDALSMRRLAAELGAGTMTLYHYIRTKDELLTLVVDAVMGEVVVPADELVVDDWRAAISAIARRTKAMLERHPWVLDIMDDPGLGPNSVRHFDQTLAATSSYSDNLTEQLDVLLAVDEYVFGHCLHQRMNYVHAQSVGNEQEMLAYAKRLLASGEYPHIGAQVAAMGFDRAWQVISDHGRDADRFERGLRRLLAGFDAERHR